jgi:hypothetical protein
MFLVSTLRVLHGCTVVEGYKYIVKHSDSDETNSFSISVDA